MTEETTAPSQTYEVAPNDVAPPPGETRNDIPAEGTPEARKFTLEQLAKGEDASGVIEELRDRGESTDEHSRARRSDRYAEAVRRAQEETDKTLGEQPKSENEVPEDFDADAFLSKERSRAQCQLRIQQYEEQNPGFTQEVFSTFEAFGDLEDHVTEGLQGSPYAPEIIHRIVQNPDSIEMLNQLKPAEVTRFLAMVEGAMMTQKHQANDPDHIAQRKALWEAQNRRTVSKAPPPMKPVRGGANPMPDLHELAKKGEDATDFIKESRRRERARQQANA
jgi:hypothetical protein